ncbi:unnamed protein product [Mucor hiemalis]
MNQYSNKFSSTTTNDTNKMYNSTFDVTKHIISLQARLGFARFKMRQGWESSTLLDVEQLWKQKQQQSIRKLPKPRFTQRDIIDKRSYIPSPGARHAKAKKAKLVRTYSNPLMDSSRSTLHFHHYNHGKKRQQKKDDSLIIDDTSSSPPSPSYSSYSDGDHEQHVVTRNNNRQQNEYIDLKEPPVRNSLDYLSYAIAMTEREEGSSSQPLPDICEIEPNLLEEEEEVEKLISPPSSPVTSAAKAIMMFVNNGQPTLI